MNNTLTKINNAYVTMVMGKTVDMSPFYSHYTKKELVKLRGIVIARINELDADLTALRQQLKDIDKNMSQKNCRK